MYINEKYIETSEETIYKNVKIQRSFNYWSRATGLFAGLKLIENGIKPIIIERGKKVRNRRRDLASLTKII